MSINSHIDALKDKHANLEKHIKSANDNHNNDSIVKGLKKQKLKIKDQIEKIEQTYI